MKISYLEIGQVVGRAPGLSGKFTALDIQRAKDGSGVNFKKTKQNKKLGPFLLLECQAMYICAIFVTHGCAHTHAHI